MDRPLCLAHLSLLALSPPAFVDVAADAGFSTVSLRLAPASDTEPRHAMAPGSPLLRDTVARLQARGLQVHEVELVRLAPDPAAAAPTPLLEAAAALGARRLLVAGDGEDEAAAAGQLDALAQRVAPYGLSLGLEFMPWRGIRDLAAARRVVERAGCGGIVVDAIHLDRSGGTATDLAALPASAWAWFQVCDAPAERPQDAAELLRQARHARLPPGHGGLDLVGMLRALPPDCSIAVEAPLDSDATPAERAHLLYQATQQVLVAAALPH